MSGHPLEIQVHQKMPFNRNPFASADADWIAEFLRMTCAEGLNQARRCEVEDQIEALVPALLELRDGARIDLNAVTLAKLGSFEGFSQLALDTRLTESTRTRCEAIRRRLVVQGMKALTS